VTHVLTRRMCTYKRHPKTICICARFLSRSGDRETHAISQSHSRIFRYEGIREHWRGPADATISLAPTLGMDGGRSGEGGWRPPWSRRRHHRGGWSHLTHRCAVAPPPVAEEIGEDESRRRTHMSRGAGEDESATARVGERGLPSPRRATRAGEQGTSPAGAPTRAGRTSPTPARSATSTPRRRGDDRCRDRIRREELQEAPSWGAPPPPPWGARLLGRRCSSRPHVSSMDPVAELPWPALGRRPLSGIHLGYLCKELKDKDELLLEFPCNPRTLVVDYFTYAVWSGALARRAACRRLLRLRRAARRRLLRLRRASGCLGSSRGSSSTTCYLAARLLVGRSYWLSSCARSLCLAA
jgi:hypothetical protein